jgi:GNAT superfamily N-acetyltransferase
MLSDDAITRYVDGVDFTRHTMLGAFNEHAQLIGLAELAPGAEESELAFSVRPDLRCRGIGTRLMKRALLYARISGARKAFVMFLSDNTPMSRMARNAGMQVKTAGGEAYAARELAAPSAQELSSWFIEEAVAQGEYFSVLGIERWGSLLAPPGAPRAPDARDAVAV